MTKRIMLLLVVLLSLCVAAGTTLAAQSPHVPLVGNAIPQFVQPLPLLSVAGGTMATVGGNQPLTIRMCEFNAQILPPPMPATSVWGYIAGACPATTIQDTCIGPVIVNTRGTSTDITWVNRTRGHWLYECARLQIFYRSDAALGGSERD